MLQNENLDAEQIKAIMPYFKQDAIQKIIQTQLKKAELQTCQDACSGIIQKGLYDHLARIIESLIEISRARQFFKGIHPSNQAKTVLMIRIIIRWLG